MLLASFLVALPALLAAAGGADLTPPPPPAAPASLVPAPAPRRTAQADRVDLKDAKDGSGDLLYETSGFTARVAPDGGVSFKDKRVSGLSAFPWLPMKTRMGVPSLQASLLHLLGGPRVVPPPPSELDEGLAPPETKQVIPEVSRYRPDPRENCRNCPAFNELVVPLEGAGRFDVSDEINRFSGKDPNRFQKAAFLAATHDQRIQMAVKVHGDYIRRAAAELPGRLQAIACDERLSYRERRAILAQLAREMDTTLRDGANGAVTINAFVARFDAGDVACAKPP